MAEPLCPICGVDVPHTHGSKKDWLARRRAEDKARAEEKARMTAEPHDLQPGVPCRVPGCPGPNAARTADPGGLRLNDLVLRWSKEAKDEDAIGGDFAGGVSAALRKCIREVRALTPEATAPGLDPYSLGWNAAMDHAARIADSLAASATLNAQEMTGDELRRVLTPEATAPDACDVCLSFGHLSCDRCGHCLVRARERHRALTPEATAPRAMTIDEWEALPYTKVEPDEGYG